MFLNRNLALALTPRSPWHASWCEPQIQGPSEDLAPPTRTEGSRGCTPSSCRRGALVDLCGYKATIRSLGWVWYDVMTISLTCRPRSFNRSQRTWCYRGVWLGGKSCLRYCLSLGRLRQLSNLGAERSNTNFSHSLDLGSNIGAAEILSKTKVPSFGCISCYVVSGRVSLVGSSNSRGL